MTEASHALAHRFLAALSAGAVPDDLLTDDMTVWTTTGGTSEKARWQGGLAMLSALFTDGLTYTADAITAEADRIAIEAHSAGTLRDGSAFANRYVFILRTRDGRIAAIAEHMNPKPVEEQIRPAMMALMAARQG